MLKKVLWVIALIALLVTISGVILYRQVVSFADTALTFSEPKVIHLKSGQSAHTVFSALDIEQSSLNKLYFKLWLRLYPENTKVKTGYYQFSPGALLDASSGSAGHQTITISHVFDVIRNGKESQFSITLVEGLTLKQWLSSLKNSDSLTQDIPENDVLYASLTGASESFCANELKSLEGCLLADTYFYRYQDSALSILQRAYDEMGNALMSAWSQRYQDIPLRTPYEALILASIIEKETAVASERELIAGVFSNRLELNMRLQTDPTVIYGIGEDFDGNITRKHLREYTPYNTYRIKGLPPTPIAMAGRESLMAAVKPDITDYIYFVAKGDGSHQFSVTLSEHNAAVAKYQLKR